MVSPYQLIFDRIWQATRRSLSFLWLVVIAAYFSVSAGHAVYANYQEQQRLKALQQQLVAAQLEQERLQALLVYYNTPDYQELALRQDLLLQQPGEQVYALPESSTTTLSDEDVTAAAAQVSSKNISHDPLWRQWAKYLWDGSAS